MIFHPIVGKEIKENTGTFNCKDANTIEVGFQPDAIWITEDGLLGQDYTGQDMSLGCGCNFASAGMGKVMTFKGTKVSEAWHLQQVFLYQTASGFAVAFSLSKMDGTSVSNVTKTYTYHAIKYS